MQLRHIKTLRAMASSFKFPIMGLATFIALIFVHLMLISTITTADALSNNATNESLAPKSNATQTATTTTTTTAPTTTSAPTTTTSTTPEPPAQSTMREPSEQEISEARKIIHEIAYTMKAADGRMALNKPIANQLQDFAPESPEARVADAATQFGVNFINSLPNEPRENVVVSPVSLQILLNIILLGSQDQSPTQIELARVLGYESNGLFAEIDKKSATDNSTSGAADQQEIRTRPHAAMHSLLESISQATHPTIDSEQRQQQLLNSNNPQLAAVLQTTNHDSGTPLTSQVNFTLANLMLTNKDLVRTSANYDTDLKRFYDIKLENFSRSNPDNKTDDTRALHERVNGWVQNVTKNQISELVSKDDLDGDDLAMVLLNAAHFKGRWLHTFSTKLTQERLFYNQGQESGGQEVKFMRQTGVFGYAEFGSSQMTSVSGEQQAAGQQTSTSDETVLTEDSSTTGRDNDKTNETLPVIELSKEEAKRFELTSNLNCSVLMMPFALNDGQELSMVILLPNKRDGLRDLMANLNGPALNEIYRSLNEQQVQVDIPKFSFESSLDAKTTLQKMGLTRIFQMGAELGRMLSDDSPTNVTKVDKVVHKAKIAVDELGAEAAAASASTIVLRNLIRPPNPSFVADHPFLFVIRHNRSNLPLFMGTINKL